MTRWLMTRRVFTLKRSHVHDQHRELVELHERNLRQKLKANARPLHLSPFVTHTVTFTAGRWPKKASVLFHPVVVATVPSGGPAGRNLWNRHKNI